MSWEHQFRERMNSFGTSKVAPNDLAISIKVRPVTGCFHRQHSPAAYEIIDNALQKSSQDDFQFEEHESGPEILAWVSLATVGISLTAAVINLVAAIIKARSEGIKKGDTRSEPVEVIVRGLTQQDSYFEETIFRIPSDRLLSSKEIEEGLTKALAKHQSPKRKAAKKRKK